MENESWKSLKEVSEETGLSRRMIQEYEKAPTSEKYKKYGGQRKFIRCNIQYFSRNDSKFFKNVI